MAKYYFWICHCIFRNKLSPDPVQMAHYQFAGIVPEVHSASLAVPEPPAGGTLVSQPIEEMGRLAIKVLFDMIKTGTRMVSQIELSTELIVRDSIRML